MLSKIIIRLTALVGVLLFCTFILGLTQSISAGFAGFLGGLPFTIIALSVIAMVVYDFWDQCIRQSNENKE